MSTHLVSHAHHPLHYPLRVMSPAQKREVLRKSHGSPTLDGWQGWRARFRSMAKKNGKSLRAIAEQLDISESTMRSWTNGHRDINLTDFFRICEAAGISPQLVLFATKENDSFNAVVSAWNNTNNTGQEHILIAAEGALHRYGVPKPD